MVAFPDVQVDLPILGIDIVAFGGRPTMCIADASPTRLDMTLPDPYLARVRELWRDHEIRSLLAKAPRDPPSWGRDIFGPFCVLAGECALDQFGSYAKELLDVHLSYEPHPSTDPEETARAIRRYTRQQRKNTKTQNMLRSCFGPEFAKDYMATVMFDSAV